MKISVINVQLLENSGQVEFQFDQERIVVGVSESTIYDVPGTQAMTINNDRVCLLLTRAGLGGNFAKDYWATRNGKARSLPWEYGEFPELQ